MKHVNVMEVQSVNVEERGEHLATEVNSMTLVNFQVRCVTGECVGLVTSAYF